MRSISFLLLTFLSFTIFGQQELNFTPKITKATVYRSGAKVSTQQQVYLNKGQALVKLENLSPRIDENSIRVEGLDGISLNYFTFETDYLTSGKNSKQLEQLKDQLKSLNQQIAKKQNKSYALSKELELLQKNQNLNSDSNGLSVAKMNAYAEYYRNKIEDIKNQDYNISIDLEELNKQRLSLEQEIYKFDRRNKKNRGTIKLHLDVKQASSKKIKVSYFIYDAGWFPSYDLSSGDISSSIQLDYNAKVHQNSGLDWKNIELSLSTANPQYDSRMPELTPFYVNYHTPYSPYNSTAYNFSHLTYNSGVRTVSGIVRDQNGMPLPGVNVKAKGSNNGTQTDFDGRYSIKVDGAKSLIFKYLGFITAEIPVYSSTITFNMKTDASSLDEVVVTGYSKAKNRNRDVTSELAEATNKPKVNDDVNSFSFTFPSEVSLPSNYNDSSFKINTYQLETEYTYYVSSEYNAAAFLIAKISNWQDLNLISGDAKIYFNNSYVGKTNLNLNTTKKELVISLGKDDQIVVNRKDLKQEQQTSFLGGNKIINKSYEIEIRNNKSSPISVLLEERIPISVQEDIKVDELEHDASNYDKKLGYLQWELNLDTKSKTIKTYSYQVKYPKDKQINMSN